MIKYAILGASGHGKVVADAIFNQNNDIDIVFFDDAFPQIQNNAHWPIAGSLQDLIINIDTFDGVVIAIGNNFVRHAKQLELQTKGAHIISVIHPKAVVSPFANIGSGVVVLAGAVINAGADVADACIVNSNSVVEHDCKLSEAVHISPGASVAGGVMIGQYSWIGIGACVKQLVHIGKNVIVGAGSTVLNNIENDSIVVGSPARLMRIKSNA